MRLANLKSGGLDLIERVLATDIKDVRADPELELSTALGARLFRPDHQYRQRQGQGAARASRAKVRQALDLSIDREALNQVVFNGEFAPGNQWVSPKHPYYQKAFPVRGRDIAKAKALMKEAGVTTPVDRRLHGAEGRRERSGRRGRAVDGRGGGLRHQDPRGRIRDHRFKQAEAGEYQIFLIGWSGRIDPDGNSYIFMRSKAPQNDGGYSNPEVDKLLEDARLTSDVAERKAIYEKVAKILLDEVPIIYLYHRTVLIAHTTKLEGYRQMPDGLVRVVGLKFK